MIDAHCEQRTAKPRRQDASALADLALVRLATGGAATKSDLVRDLGPIAAGTFAANDFRAALDAQLAKLTSGGLVLATGARLAVAPAGLRQAETYAGGKLQPVRSWDAARAGVLCAKALGLASLGAAQKKALMRSDGLAGAIVTAAFAIRQKGGTSASPSRLRAALAVIALERAFGDQHKTGLDDKSGLSAKAGRLLAAQLLAKPRAVGTDGRLIAALAADAVGAAKADLKSLQSALLRRLVVEAPTPAVNTKVARKPRLVSAVAPATPPVQPASVTVPVAAIVPAPAPPIARPRPDLDGFVAQVRAATAERASGWAGNRKAFISHVYRAVQARQPAWALTEIEFKSMLVAAHGAGRIVLANADLKDASTVKDVQESAIAFKNAVFHFVRVED